MQNFHESLQISQTYWTMWWELGYMQWHTNNRLHNVHKVLTSTCSDWLFFDETTVNWRHSSHTHRVQTSIDIDKNSVRRQWRTCTRRVIITGTRNFQWQHLVNMRFSCTNISMPHQDIMLYEVLPELSTTCTTVMSPSMWRYREIIVYLL